MVINQLKLGAFLSYTLIGLNVLVGLVYTPYMLRMLGKSEFGLYSLVGSVVAYLTILDLGFGNAIVRYTAKFRTENKFDEQYEMFGMFISLYTIIGVVVFLLGLSFYFNVDILFRGAMTSNEIDRAKIMILLMIFNIAISFPLSIFGSIISGYEDFVFQKVIQILRIILNTILMIVILEYGYRAIGMVVLATILNITTLLINFWYSIYKLKIKIYFRKFQWVFLKEVSIYSFYIFLIVIMDRIYWSTGQFVLGSYAGTEAVAVFAVAIQLQAMYLSFSLSISGVFLPRLTSMTAQNKPHQVISDLFIRIGRIQYIILAFILTGFVLFGKQFIILWAGPDYEGAYIITLLFFVPLTIPLCQSLGMSILQARNQMKFRSLVFVAIALTSLGFQIPLAKMYGGIGIGIAIAGSLLIGQIIIMNIYYYKVQKIDIPKFWLEIGKMTFVPFIIGVIGYCLLLIIEPNTILSLVLTILVFILIYIPSFWITSMNQYEKDLIGKSLYVVIKWIKQSGYMRTSK